MSEYLSLGTLVFYIVVILIYIIFVTRLLRDLKYIKKHIHEISAIRKKRIGS